VTFRHTLVSWQNFATTILKTPNIKIVVNYLSSLPVSHTATTDAEFNGYKFSKTGNGAELSGQTGHRSELSCLGAYNE
jgi:hypothetical protein